MNGIIRWYNRNRKLFWIVILTIIAVITLIQILNNYYKNNTKDKSSSTNVSTTTYNKDNYSIVTGKEINETVSDKSVDVIKSFFDYCNSKDIDNAYNLLSTDCKEELYPTQQDFIKKYYNRIFTEKRNYDSNLWITTSTVNIYRVKIIADLLATGQKEYMSIEDYYSVIYENGEYKLSISSYIGKKDINSVKSQDGITINIKNKKMYMDYEIYEIDVQNNTGTKLIFNTKNNTDSMYLQDENGLKYIAFLNEITNNELEISNGITKSLKIKFNRGYKPTIKIKKIVFGDINIAGKEQTQNIEVEL